ncbi:RluA family pseudouridine synthase [Candidatus Saccharibacteria bacterium]|nr:RluA family pseudouridine synthase [Candidatus Saccharibacteria bacterium]
MPEMDFQGEKRHLVTGAHAGKRVDKALTELWPLVSRERWIETLRDGDVEVDNMIAKPSLKLLIGSMIVIKRFPMPRLVDHAQIQPELTIIYEDDDVIVIDKPAGLIVHPTSRKGGVSVAGALRDKVQDSDDLRPGIVHRLDQDTSGVMIVAKHSKAKQALQQAFKARTVSKKYWALVWGELGRGVQRLSFGLSRSVDHPGKIMIDPLGKPSETIVRQISNGEGVSLVEAEPITGRTHQIRVHLSAIKHPIVGDDSYGPKRGGAPRMMLHAHSLSLPLPSGKRQTFESPLPLDYLQTLEYYQCQIPH